MKYARRDSPVRIRVVEDCDGDINPLVLDRASLLPFTKEASRNGMVHSGALETAKMLYLRPELCDLAQVNDVDIQPDRSGAELYPYDVLTPYGALGKPSEATVEAGKIMWDALVKHFADAILKMADSR
jgi:creatinine amidohydrolase/Fe(II)-dependent formamide hydrolase-like protein